MAYIDTLDFVSAGVCPGCQECADAEGLSLEELEATWGEIPDGERFSWSLCDACGEGMGTVYRAHGRDSAGELVHLEVCGSCVLELCG